MVNLPAGNVIAEAVVQLQSAAVLAASVDLTEEGETEKHPADGDDPKRIADTDGDDPKRIADTDGICFDDLVLPTATVVKIMKDVLPEKAVVSKEAKETARRVATYFILYVTECASEIASSKKRKTVLAEDVVAALRELDFDDMVGRLNALLASRKLKGPVARKIAAPAAKAADDDAGIVQDVEMNQMGINAEKDQDNSHTTGNEGEATDIWPTMHTSRGTIMENDGGDAEEAEYEMDEDDHTDEEPDEEPDVEDLRPAYKAPLSRDFEASDDEEY
ncbi:hypothetical protein BV898_05905 [Hypsibius exemplaris]|uniref:DNA polymerase epsilon subunit 3 n=1 Tax=Hypsibius exemplaris TaxID=2072580 RepID=A0A1W0WYB8_HYPEX|nr:hypothetical protein BV898_05905 [Hypsibius exemplaris]